MSLIIRHSEKAHNDRGKDKEYAFDSPLTDRGYDMIEKIVPQIVTLIENPKFIVTSPLYRCRETANTLAKSFNIKVFIDIRLAEDLTKYTDEEFNSSLRPDTLALGIVKPSEDDVIARVKEFNMSIEDNVIYITHGLIVKHLCDVMNKPIRRRTNFLSGVYIKDDNYKLFNPISTRSKR